MPSTMLKFDTTRGAETTTGITKLTITCGLNINSIVKKAVHLIKETNNVTQSTVLTKYL